jgi:oligosaccharide repeat unit polymerase
MIGSDVFITNITNFGKASASTAVIVVFLFMIAINSTYCAFPAYKIERPENIRQFLDNRQMKRLKSLCTFVIIPLSLLALIIYFSTVGVSLDSFIQKRQLIDEGGVSRAYILQKVAQVSKIGLYIVFLAILCSNQNIKDWRRLLTIFFFLVFILFMSSSQRSGILIIILEICLILTLLDKLKFKQIIFIAGGFLAINLALLSARFTNGLDGINFISGIARRYFFELEKITGIVTYASNNNILHHSPWSGAFTMATQEVPAGNIHFFIGEKIFGLYNVGVPPTVLGNIILSFGTVFVIPFTCFMTAIMIKIERIGFESKVVTVKLFTIILLSCAYYILLNSDIISLFRRILLEGAFFLVAVFLFILVRQKRSTKMRQIYRPILSKQRQRWE